MTFHIRRREPLEDGLKRIAREQIGIVIGHFEDTGLSHNKKVHSLRARCKKMRALLRLCGPVMDSAFAEEDARFRDAGIRLCELRDAYVQAQTLASFKENYGIKIENVGDSFEVDPQTLNASLLEMREALAAVDDWQLNATSFYDIAPGVARTYRKGCRAWRRALESASDERFHKLRKWAKYLWYQTRILERVNKETLYLQRIRLQVLGEVLGHAHDLAVLEGVLCVRADADNSILQRAIRQKKRQYVQALKVSREVFRKTPDEVVANLALWWVDWRGGGSIAS